MNGWNLCWGSLQQFQWRQMSTNAGWFEGRSVPYLKWIGARGAPGWTGWSPWLIGQFELCVFSDEGKDEMNLQLFSSAILMWSVDVWQELFSNTWSVGSIVWESAELRRKPEAAARTESDGGSSCQALRHLKATEAVITYGTQPPKLLTPQ